MSAQSTGPRMRARASGAVDPAAAGHPGRRGPPAPRRTKAGRGSDVLVLMAAFLLSVAVSAGLHMQLGLEPILAAAAGAALFVLSVGANVIVRRAQAVGQLRRKVERMERQMAGLGIADGGASSDRPIADEGWQNPAFDTEIAANDTGEWLGEPSIEHEQGRGEAASGDIGAADDRVVNDLVRHLAGELERNAQPRQDAAPLERLDRMELEAAPAQAAPIAAATAPEPEDAIVEAAIEARAIDIYLQPIVSLADRKTRFYEIFPEVSDEAGDPLGTDRLLAAANRLDRLVELDGIVLARTAEIVTRLIDRGRARPFFVRLSRGSLADTGILKLFIEMMRTSRTLTDFLVFELDLADLGTLTELEKESIASLGQLGFRFAATGIGHLDTSLAALAADRVAFLKVAPHVLAEAATAGGDGLSQALAAQRGAGIELVIDGIEDDGVLPLAEGLHIALGQGNFFAEPRPIKPDVLSASTSAA